jgi:phosphoenolpyruvate carboxylase
MISLGHLMKDSVKLGKMDVKLGQVVSNPYAKAFVKEGEESQDHEVSMANNSLDTIIKMATELKAKMGENEKDIPAWIQDHITNAENYISQASSNYHEYGTNESVVNEDNTPFETLMLVRNLEQTNKLLAQDLKTSKRLPNDKKENIKKSIVVNQGLINYYRETLKNLKNN